MVRELYTFYLEVGELVHDFGEQNQLLVTVALHITAYRRIQPNKARYETQLILQ